MSRGKTVGRATKLSVGHQVRAEGRSGESKRVRLHGASAAPSPHFSAIAIYGQPVGKPRMTRRDKWLHRKCVTRYWAWCDLARREAFGNPRGKRTLDAPTSVSVAAFFQHKTRRGPHLTKPDGDNILKSVCDALFMNDEMVYRKTVAKYWTAGQSRVEIMIYGVEEEEEKGV